MNDERNVDRVYRDGMFEFVNENFERSIEILSEAVALDPDRKLTYVSRGSAQLKLNRLNEALADFNRAI